MSAIGQGEAAPPAEPSGGPEGAPPEATPAAPGPDFDRLYSRMDEMATQQQQIAAQMAALTEPPEEYEDESLYYDDDGGLTEEGAQAAIRELVNTQVQEALAPREKAALISRRDEDYEDLKDRYPELADEKVGGQVLAAAIGWAQRHNPDLIDKPEFVDLIEWVYKSDFRTPEAPEQEQQRRVELESASGAGSRGRAKPETDWGDRIVKAAERLRPQI